MDARTIIATNLGASVEKFLPVWTEQVAKLRAAFPDQISLVQMPGEYPTDLPIVFIKKESIVPVLQFLKETPGFSYNFLSDLTATDEEVAPRFNVVYHLLSHQSMARLRIKVSVDENEEVPTAVSVWPAANWAEREVFDMFGIRFAGHPDLRRILMDERWQGHPLRKDYPLRGYQIFPDAQPVNENLLRD